MDHNMTSIQFSPTSPWVFVLLYPREISKSFRKSANQQRSNLSLNYVIDKMPCELSRHRSLKREGDINIRVTNYIWSQTYYSVPLQSRKSFCENSLKFCFLSCKSSYSIDVCCSQYKFTFPCNHATNTCIIIRFSHMICCVLTAEYQGLHIRWTWWYMYLSAHRWPGLKLCWCCTPRYFSWWHQDWHSGIWVCVFMVLRVCVCNISLTCFVTYFYVWVGCNDNACTELWIGSEIHH